MIWMQGSTEIMSVYADVTRFLNLHKSLQLLTIRMLRPVRIVKAWPDFSKCRLVFIENGTRQHFFLWKNFKFIVALQHQLFKNYNQCAIVHLKKMSIKINTQKYTLLACSWNDATCAHTLVVQLLAHAICISWATLGRAHILMRNLHSSTSAREC